MCCIPSFNPYKINNKFGILIILITLPTMLFVMKMFGTLKP